MKLAILNENTVYKKGFSAEHGLSLLIETDGRRVLFDVGQSGIFLKNAKRMGEDLKNLEAVVISHGHYDHAGGLLSLCDNCHAPVYIQKQALQKKFSYQEKKDCYYFNGVPWLADIPKQLVCLSEPVTEILPNVFLVSQIPYRTNFEKPNPRFFLKEENGYTQDFMQDEQILVVRENGALHIVVGCAHAGIINCIYAVKERFPNEPIKSITAGMHLIDVGEKRLHDVTEALLKESFETLIPLHCTGMYAIVRLKETLKDRCKILGTGDRAEV